MTGERGERRTWLWLLSGATAVIVGFGALGAACGVITVNRADQEARPSWCTRITELLAGGGTPTPNPAAMLAMEPGTPDARSWEVNKTVWDLEYGLAPENAMPSEIVAEGKLFVAGLERHDRGEEPRAEQVAAAQELTERIEECAPPG